MLRVHVKKTNMTISSEKVKKCGKEGKLRFKGSERLCAVTPSCASFSSVE